MLTRRDLLRGGAAAAALLPLGPAPAAVGAQPLRCDLPGRSATLASAAALPEPFTLPFVLPPVRTADGGELTIEQRAAQVQILPGSSTTIWGYDGTLPGPTIAATTGRPLRVRHVNTLDVPVSVHLHGGRVPAHSDGHPTDLIAPGAAKTYQYPNTQPAATLWYHDHAMHATGRNLNRGLFGLYLLRDPSEDRLGLPAGERDVPLMLADRTFDADGQMVYPDGEHDGFLGDVPLVNGVPWPRLEVARARYRLRLLNASNARRYDLGLRASGGATLPLVQIAGDGGLLAAPVTRQTVTLSPAERVEVVVDFAAVDPGDTVVLTNRARGGMAELVRFDVTGGAVTDPSRIPPALADVEVLRGATVTRQVGLSHADGRWLIGGHGFDPDIVDAMPRLGAVEIWELRNPSPLPHPMHLHLVHFQVVDRDGVPAPAWERGWKDTVFVNAAETVRVIARFDGYPGTFVYHCHNLEHEDHDMMSQFRVVDVARLAGPGRAATAAAVAASAFPEGASVAFVASSGSFPDALAAGPAAATLGGPVLLAEQARLPQETAAALRRLAPARILVLGGPAAIGPGVEAELRGHAPEVVRVAGPSRFATAAGLCRWAWPDGAEVVYVATGAGFPDALAAGPAAARDGAPLLLVERDAIPEATAAELRRLAPGRIVVLGGEYAVSETTRQALAGYATQDVQRIRGDSRFATAAALCRWAWPDGAEVVYVATGAGFADALAAAPAAARDGAPLLLVERDGIPEATAAELRRLGPGRIVVLGGTGAVSAKVEDELGWYTRP